MFGHSRGALFAFFLIALSTFFFLIGSIVGLGVMSKLQEGVNSAKAAEQIFNAVYDVQLVGTQKIVPITISQSSILYAFGCSDGPKKISDDACGGIVPTCSGDMTMRVCVCYNGKSGCEDKEYDMPIRGSTRFEESKRVEVQKTEVEGVRSILIIEVSG